MSAAAINIAFTLNGSSVAVTCDPMRRLSDVLREDLDLPGTKVGCEAGDCGACTVLLDGAQFCACMVAAAQAHGHTVLTVEGLAANGTLSPLQQAFHANGAAQCGICTPGMLMAAHALLAQNSRPTRRQTADALGGVLCRCTGYQKIIDAVVSVANGNAIDDAPVGQAVGARLAKVDGIAKLTGCETYAADRAPNDALWMRVVRSPHPRARFALGDMNTLYARWPNLVRVITARDVPGSNRFGIYPTIKDQPLLADGQVRYRGEAVALLVGDAGVYADLSAEDVPIRWEPLEPVTTVAGALAGGAAPVQPDKPDNVLARGHLAKGDAAAAFTNAAHVAQGTFETSFVEHAYIEPEAGYARRVGDRLEIFTTTQAPYMDRDETARVLGLAPEQVRIMPSACGGGFGGKLDLSVQPLLGLAAWLLERPVRCIYTRPESMASSTKRHPAEITAAAACTRDGHVSGVEFHADFDTGAYASWGPTVADRVPVHCSGPYFVPNIKATSRAVFTNQPPAGAFRGFGVPQSAIAHEALMDELARLAAIDPLEFRLRNAIRAGQATATGQVLHHSVGLAECIERLSPRWHDWRSQANAFNQRGETLRRGVGIACMWYGCGNTSMSNPSTMHVALGRDGSVTLYTGAVDIGQGANTILTQICADALGIPAAQFCYVMGDTDRTADAGKSSASRQTLVSGKAAQYAGEDLRRQILRLTNAAAHAAITITDRSIEISDAGTVHSIALAELPAVRGDHVLLGTGTFDPPTTPLDANGQGEPYATYAFGAQIADVLVDTGLGTVKVQRMVAAHDVGKAVNPIQVEGQIHGGIAQGLGLALMEEYVPGRTENLHDYLIPTFGDMPEIETIIVEAPEPLGPYGAKGVGEPALIATPAAILGAIHHATGVRITRVPATPHRLRAAIVEAEQTGAPRSGRS